jgi:hypothetical protein
MIKLKFILAGWAIAVTVFAGIVFITNFAMDFSTYQSIFEGNYETPWYSPNWFKEPYTNFKLSEHEKEAVFYVTTNACGSQIWLVKEVKIGDKAYWTTEQRMEITNFIH